MAFLSRHRALIVAQLWLRLVMTCGLFCVVAPALAEDGSSVVVITSRDDGPYELVLEGVRETLADGGDMEQIEIHSLQSEQETAVNVLRVARKGRGVPIVTVGSVATRAALQLQGDAPIIACMIVDEKDLDGASDATGVVLEYPIRTQLEWVQRFVPGSQTIGILFNPNENLERVNDARRIARNMGIRVVAEEVHRPQDLPGALDSLAREVDVLFAITDRTVLSPQTAQAILLFSFRNRIPFSGLSASWVRAGALYSLERDYQDLGAQCAEMAIQVLQGKPVQKIPTQMPRKLTYSVNMRTAEHLKLSLPSSLVEEAGEVFR